MLIISRTILGKEKPLYCTKYIDEGPLIDLKEKSPLYAEGEGLKRKNMIHP